MEKEKKQIKISLWAFYVLMAGIVILIGAVIIGGIGIKKQMNNLEQGQVSLTNQVTPEQNNEISKVQNKVENVSQNDVNVKENNLKDVTLDDKDVQKCLNYLKDTSIIESLYFEAKQQNQKLTVENISNSLILGIGISNLYSELNQKSNNSEIYEELMNKTKVSSEELDKEIKKIFGYETKYNNQDFVLNIGLGSWPTIESATYNSNTYNVSRYFESNPYYNSYLFIDNLIAKKDKNILTLTIPYAFCKQQGELMENYRDDWYLDAEFLEEPVIEADESQSFFKLKNLIGHSYYDGERISKEDMKKMEPSLIVNDNLEDIYDNTDKLHKIKMTFTKDDTNEYHFESFEIID